jgi:hypothetical protein
MNHIIFLTSAQTADVLHPFMTRQLQQQRTILDSHGKYNNEASYLTLSSASTSSSSSLPVASSTESSFLSAAVAVLSHERQHQKYKQNNRRQSPTGLYYNNDRWSTENDPILIEEKKSDLKQNMLDGIAERTQKNRSSESIRTRLLALPDTVSTVMGYLFLPTGMLQATGTRPSSTHL